MTAVRECPNCEYSLAPAVEVTTSEGDAVYRFECPECDHIWEKDIQ